MAKSDNPRKKSFQKDFKKCLELKKPKIKKSNNTKKNKNAQDSVVNHQIKEKEIINRVEQGASSSQILDFFLNEYQSGTNIKLSWLELEKVKDTCILKLSEDLDQDVSSLSEHIKAAFGPSWKEMLCDNQLSEGKVDPGSPAVIVISASALRSLEVLRGLRLLTKECPAAKLFSKHMKVDEQVSLLKSRTNIVAGTPNRIKKLIDMEALGLSCLNLIVLDMHMDVKGYSLISLPQVRDEFWDLYRTYFHDRLVSDKVRICLYGPTLVGSSKKKK